MAKLPRDAAKWRGLLESLGLTGVLTSSFEAWAKTSATDFMSDLKMIRQRIKITYKYIHIHIFKNSV